MSLFVLGFAAGFAGLVLICFIFMAVLFLTSTEVEQDSSLSTYINRHAGKNSRLN